MVKKSLPNPLSLRHQAYQHLQKKILSGDFPAGHVISENTVAKEIGMSRTPVREAIRDMEQEGVLKQVPRYGTVVRELSRRDLVELYELREALEPFAVAQAAGRVGANDLNLLEKLCDEIKAIAADVQKSATLHPDADMMRRLLSADLSFHMLLLRNSGNQRMMKIVGDSRLLTGIFATPRQEHNLDVIKETHRFHLLIFKAVRDGDAEKARSAMAEHIRASKQETLAHFDRMQSEPDHQNTPLGLPADVMADLKRLEKRK
ncbi:GntR family transcriptional regulator [soil metagenome]